MILPNKYISVQDCIFTSSAMILNLIKDKSLTTDKLWGTCDKKYNQNGQVLSYDKFIISLTFMYSCAMIKIDEKGEISK
ncbi:MAG: hypothetical protein RBR50_10715 [Candidatus Izemoplasmatales bacterium]|nr:hypothetical protein [Candidatus Izemoplasmatales bacterium]